MQLPESQIRDIDVPELSETFVDSFGSMTFDGQTARIELRVTRMDMVKPPAKPTAKRYPAVRLVLTPDAVVILSNQLHMLISVLEKEGKIKRVEPEKPTIH